MLTVTILDGYVDEPTCLGVPPYMSPYPRYIAGAIWSYDKTTKVLYVTIDQIRKDQSLQKLLLRSDILIVIAGMAVPGRYLSGYPCSPNELITLLQNIQKPIKILGGPAARYGFGLSGGKKTRDIGSVVDVFDMIATGDAEIIISDLLKNNCNLDKIDGSRYRSNPDQIQEFSIKGATIVKQHPFFPTHLIMEIETYRGCPRSITGGCSFCSEPSKGIPQFRSIESIIKEIQALYHAGIRHFRIGNQPCIFSYMAQDAGKEEFPRPNPAALEKLFKKIRTAAPQLKTLHIDNANPGILARFPKECTAIAKSIIHYHTPGDVAALGVESVDPIVIRKNNLKASADEVMAAITLLNKVGSKRGLNGLPELLPGLNFVFGLEGETKETFHLDYKFLQQIYNNGFLLRRINLRQVIPLTGTRMSQFGNKNVKKHKTVFHQFKRKVKDNIERPMLKRLFPPSTLLKEVYTEIYQGKLTYGRQMGSYPLLVGMPGVFPLHRFLNVKVVDYGYRSITAIPYPLDINTAPRETLETLPGIGSKRAIRILRKRPFQTRNELMNIFDDQDVAKSLLEYIAFK
jgi:radical SAM superfamily enzyme with C-terminal helix-hairpin-helix motif